jgi:hypothetical protein
MRFESASDQCVEALARFENELSAKLDALAKSQLNMARTQARRELWAWCGFSVVLASSLTVVGALALPLVR